MKRQHNKWKVTAHSARKNRHWSSGVSAQPGHPKQLRCWTNCKRGREVAGGPGGFSVPGRPLCRLQLRTTRSTPRSAFTLGSFFTHTLHIRRPRLRLNGAKLASAKRGQARTRSIILTAKRKLAWLWLLSCISFVYEQRSAASAVGWLPH